MGVDTEIAASGTSPSQVVQLGGRQVDRNRIKFEGLPILSREQIIQILLFVGFPPEKVVAFAAVAYRESANGGTWIVGGPTGGYSNEYSFGIFGLNTLGGMWDEMRRMVPGLSNRNQLLDPVMNARVALAMYKKYGERPWKVLNGKWNPNGSMTNSTNVQAAQAAWDRLVVTKKLLLTSSQIYAQLGAFTKFGAPRLGDRGSQGVALEPPPADSGLSPSTDTETIDMPGGGTVTIGVPPAGTPVQNPSSPEEIEAYIRQNYGYMVGFLNHPELGPILIQAAKEGLSKELLYGRITATNWWKTTSDAQRKWQALANEDPATAANEVAKKKAQITDLAARKGWELDDAQLTWLATHALHVGLSDAQVLDYLVTYNSQTLAAQGPTFVKGELGSMVNRLRAESRRWMVPLTDPELNEYSKQIAIDSNTFEGMQAFLANNAKKKFSGNQTMVDAIGRGIAPGDLLAPQVSRIAQTLEMSPDAIDLLSERWAPIYQKATKAGQGVMNLDEVAKFARQQDEYLRTTGARRSLLGVDAMIRQAFGF